MSDYSSIETKDRNSLNRLFDRLKGQLPGKTISSVYLDICDRKADAAILLEQIISWWEEGDAHVCNWSNYKGSGDREVYRYMFLTSSDLKDMWDGKTLPRRPLEFLKEKGFISVYHRHKNNTQGRLIRVKFQNVYKACLKVVTALLNTHTVSSGRKSLLTRARTHTPQAFDLYTFQDIISGTVQRAYHSNPEKVLSTLTEFNTGRLDFNDWRSAIAKCDPSNGKSATENIEPTRIEWTVPRLTTKEQHAGNRLIEISSIFTRATAGLAGTVWQPENGRQKRHIQKLICSGDFDLFKFQFIAISFYLDRGVREALNNSSVKSLQADLTSPLLLCYEHMRSAETYDKDPWGLNELIFNELYTLGWLELRAKFKNAVRGKVLLEKLILDNKNYGSTSALQRLCLYGKMFPDEKTLLRKYMHKSSTELGTVGVASTLKTLGHSQRKILRAMYPSVFQLLEIEARC